MAYDTFVTVHDCALASHLALLDCCARIKQASAHRMEAGQKAPQPSVGCHMHLLQPEVFLWILMLQEDLCTHEP